MVAICRGDSGSGQFYLFCVLLGMWTVPWIFTSGVNVLFFPHVIGSDVNSRKHCSEWIVKVFQWLCFLASLFRAVFRSVCFIFIYFCLESTRK